MYDIPSIKLATKKFLEVSRCSRAKQRQRNIGKKWAARAKLLFFLLVRPSPLSITRFFTWFEQTINIIESFPFSPG